MREVAEIKIGDNDSVYPLKEKILQEPQFKYMKSKDLTLMTNFREMMRVITVSLPPDAAKSKVAEIEIASNNSVYSLKEKILKESNFNNLKTKDLTLMTSGRRLVDRDCVSEIPELADEPMVKVIATKKAATIQGVPFNWCPPKFTIWEQVLSL